MNGDVTLAVTDTGPRRDGAPTIVLMHGLGMTQKSMTQVAALLPDWRIANMDLRGHGKSTTGPWTFANAVSDVDAVIAHFGLERPYVGGHSLGGMVALQYAMAGRPAAGVINIDGWGGGVPSRYPGEDPAAVEAMLRRATSGQQPLVARALTALMRQTREGTTRQVIGLLDGADVLTWHRDLACPVLTFNAVAPAGRVVTRIMGKDAARMHGAYRQGLRRGLAELTVEQPNVTVVEVDATHRLNKTQPAAVASAIAAFHAAHA